MNRVDLWGLLAVGPGTGTAEVPEVALASPWRIFAGVETIGLGSLLTTAGGVALKAGTAAAVIGGGFWIVTGSIVILAGVEMIAGDSFTPISELVGWIRGNESGEESGIER